MVQAFQYPRLTHLSLQGNAFFFLRGGWGWVGVGRGMEDKRGRWCGREQACV